MKKILMINVALLTVLFGGLLRAGEVADSMVIESAYVRATPPGLSVSAAYLTIHNNDNSEHVLVNANTDAAGSVEFHSHVHDNGVMRMRKMEGVPIGASSRVVFAPGGFHIMLIGLTRELNRGEELQLDLEFEDGSYKPVIAPVK